MDLLSQLFPDFKISQTGEIKRKTIEEVGPDLLVLPIASESIKQNKIIFNYNFL